MVAGSGTTYTLAAAVSTTRIWSSPVPPAERIRAQELSTATTSAVLLSAARSGSPIAPRPSR
jgi:hypothetical protein